MNSVPHRFIEVGSPEFREINRESLERIEKLGLAMMRLIQDALENRFEVTPKESPRESFPQHHRFSYSNGSLSWSIEADTRRPGTPDEWHCAGFTLHTNGDNDVQEIVDIIDGGKLGYETRRFSDGESTFSSEGKTWEDRDRAPEVERRLQELLEFLKKELSGTTA